MVNAGTYFCQWECRPSGGGVGLVCVIFIVCFILYPLPNRELCELDKPFSSSSTYWEEILNMTFDWSNGKMKIQHYVKTNSMGKLKIIMTLKIYMNNDKYYYIFFKFFFYSNTSIFCPYLKSRWTRYYHIQYT